MPAREAPLCSRSPRMRSRSHVSPTRRPRRRTHSHSPTCRRPRVAAGAYRSHHHGRGRSPPGPLLRSSRVPRVTSTLTTCSTMPGYSSGYSHQRHRDVEECSTSCLIGDRRESEDDENRENRRRMIEGSVIYSEEVEDENIRKESMQNRICRAARVVSGFLLSMGLILVFYVIITTILGESTPLDVFNFELGSGELMKHQNNVTNSVYSDILKRKNQEFIPNPGNDTPTSFTLDIIEIEPRSTGPQNDDDDDSKGQLEVGNLLERKDYEEPETYYKDEGDDNYEYYDVYTDGNFIQEGNVTEVEDLEGRSYIAYIPVPLNNEEEDEEEEEEEEEKEDNNKRSSQSQPLFIPVMIMPGGMTPNGGMNRNPIMPPNRQFNRPRPPSPARGPLLLQPPRSPLMPVRNIPRVPQNIPKVIPNPQMTLLNQNNFGNRQHVSLPPLPALPPIRNGIKNPNAPVFSNSNLFNIHQTSATGNQNNGGSFPVNGNQVPFPPNGNNGNRVSSFNNRNGINGNNGLHNNNNDNNNNMLNSGDRNNFNTGRGMSGSNAYNGYGGNVHFNGNEMNNPNRMNIMSNIGTSGNSNAGEDIWNSLFEIMNLHQRNSPTSSNSRSTGTMNTLGTNIQPVRSPLSFSSPVPRNSMLNLRQASRSTVREMDDLRPSTSQLHRRLRPRLLPKSRMSGPLPKARGPFPRYRYRLPPIPPPPGMPIIPRRVTRHRQKPPREFQYPRDSSSIQDIIKFMRDREKNQGSTGIITGSQHHIVGHNSFGPNSGFNVGDQNHIIGQNPFGDTLSNINIEGPEDVGFGNVAQSGNHNDIGESNINGGTNSHTGGGDSFIMSGGGGIPGYNNGGNNFNNDVNNYNNGGSNFNNGNNYNSGNNNGGYNSGANNLNNGGYTLNSGGNNGGYTLNSGGNNNGYTLNSDSNNGGYTLNSGGNNGGYTLNSGGNNGGYTLNSGSNNNGYTLNSDSNNGGYTVNSDSNNGENTFNTGSGNQNNGGNYLNTGSNNYNNGGNNQNNGGNNYNNDGGSGVSAIPPVLNTYNTNSANSAKSRPFNIMLDVYPMDIPSGSSGTKPFQTNISFGSNGKFNSNQNQYNGNSSGNDNRYNNNAGNGNGYNNNGFSNSNGGRFTPEDDANRHEVILHLNLFSKTPANLRNNGRNNENSFTGRSGAVSLAVPLSGQLSPLDIYRAIMAKARTRMPQAMTQFKPGEEEEEEGGTKPTNLKDEVEIELFDVEEGPRLLEAITFGLQQLNEDLPPSMRFVISNKPTSSIELYEAVNGDIISSASGDPTSPSEKYDVFSNHNYNATSYPNYKDTDYYYYYDYYEYDGTAYEGDKVSDAEGEKTTETSATTTTGSVQEVHEQLPTPCWHQTGNDDRDH